MITWIIIVAIFVIAFLWRVLEKVREKPENGNTILDPKTGIIMKEHIDEFDD